MRHQLLWIAICLLTLSELSQGQDCEGFEVDFLSAGLGSEADQIIDLAYTPNGNALVVAHQESRNITVLDEVTGALLRTIDLSGTPQSLAVSPSGIHCAVSLIDSNAVSICRLTTGLEESVVPVGLNPAPIRFDSSGSLIVVGNTGEDTLSVIDFATRTETRRVNGAGFFTTSNASIWSPFETFSEFEITPDGSTAVVPDLSRDRVAILDLQGGPASFVAAPNPFGIALSADGSTAVTSPHFPETELAVIDIPARSLLALRDTGLLPAFTPPITMRGDASKVWVGTRVGIASIDLISGMSSPPLVSSEFIRNIALTSDESYVVLGSDLGHVLDAVTGSILAEVREGFSPPRMAVSPTSFRAAFADPGNNDLIELWNTEGALASFDQTITPGFAPEGDRAKRVVVAENGSVACVLNNHSQNVTIVELPAPGTWSANVEPFVRDIVPAGAFPGELAISPDGRYAVATLFGEDQVTIIDTPAPGAARRVQLTFAAGPVIISADSTTAYVIEFEDPAVTAGAGLWRIDLATGLTIGPRLSTGEPGGGGYAFTQISGLALSPDGNTLLCCNGGSDDVSIVDLPSWTEVIRLPVGAYPVRAAIAADGMRAFVVSRNDQVLTEITLAPAGGGLPMVSGTAPLGFQPFEIVLHPDGLRAFVAAYGDTSIDLVDLSSLTVTLGAIPLPSSSASQPLDLQIDNSGDNLIVGTRGGEIHRIDTTALQIESSISIDATPADLAWSDVHNTAFVASPIAEDGLIVARSFEECAEAFCFGDGGVSPGCTDCPCGNQSPQGSEAGCLGPLGTSGKLISLGRPRLSDESLQFEVEGLPGVTFALLVTGPNALPNSGPCPPGSGLTPPTLDGLRCVGGGTQRLGARQSDALGTIGRTTPGWGPNQDLLNTNVSGATVLYQAFYRKDPSLGCQTGLNTTNALRLVVSP